jgi:hypothetical protein
MDAPQPKDKLSTLYETLKKEQYDVPTIDVFKKDMSDVSKRTRLHETLLKDNFDVPAFDKFSVDLGFGKEQPKETKQFDVKMPDAFQAQEPLQKIPSYKDKFFDEKRFVSESTRGPKIQTETRQDIVQQADKRKNDALDNTINKWAKQNNLDANSPKAKEQRKLYEKGLTDGGIISAPSFSIGASKDGPIIYRNTGMLDSFANSYDKVKQEINEAKDIKEMSDADAINVLKEKMSKEGEAVPEKAYGLGGGFGEFFGGAARMILTQEAAVVAVQSGLGLLAPETGGLSLLVASGLAGSEAISSDMQNQAYLSEIQKRFAQGLKEGKDEKEAMRLARIQAERAADISTAEAYAFGFAGQGVKKIFSKPVSGAGVKESLGKVIMSSAKEIAPELIGATAVVTGSSVAKDISAKQLGYKVDSKEMFDNAWDSATETWKFIGALTMLHGTVNKIKQLPGYAVSQLKSFVNSADKGVPQTILDNLAKNKFLDPVEVEKTKKALEEHNVAADQTAALGITDEAAKGAISGKQEKKIKLQKEIDELQKNNITAGVEERLYQIDKLNKEIDEIYKTGNINQHEFDNQLPTQEDISQPIELSPELPEGYVMPTEVTTTPVTTTEVKPTELPALSDVESTAKALEEPIGENEKGFYPNVARVNSLLDSYTLGYNLFEELKYIGEEHNKRIDEGVDFESSDAIYNKEYASKISEAYHKAKADGSNPELVKAVESLLSKEQPKALETQPTKTTPTTETAKVEDTIIIDGVEYTFEEAIGKARSNKPFGSRMEYKGSNEQAKRFVESYNKDTSPYKEDGSLKGSYINEQLRKALNELSFRKFADLYRKHFDKNFTNKKDLASYTVGDNIYDYAGSDAQFKAFAKDAGIEIPKKEIQVEDTTQQTTTEVENIINTFQQSVSGYAKEDVLTSGQKKSITQKANNAIKKLKSILGFDTGNLPSHTKEQSEALKNIQYLSSESRKFETIKDLFDQYAQDKLNNKETDLTKAIDNLYKFKKETDAHVDALNQTIKNTEYEQQARNLGLREEPTGGTTAEVPTEPTGKPIEDATAPNEARATFEDAGYDSEQSARDAYESERDVATNQTYEEWLLEKYCG